MYSSQFLLCLLSAGLFSAHAVVAASIGPGAMPHQRLTRRTSDLRSEQLQVIQDLMQYQGASRYLTLPRDNNGKIYKEAFVLDFRQDSESKILKNAKAIKEYEIDCKWAKVFAQLKQEVDPLPEDTPQPREFHQLAKLLLRTSSSSLTKLVEILEKECPQLPKDLKKLVEIAAESRTN